MRKTSCERLLGVAHKMFRLPQDTAANGGHPYSNDPNFKLHLKQNKLAGLTLTAHGQRLIDACVLPERAL